MSDDSTVTIRVGGPAVTRIAGMDRYEGAALVARQTHPGTSVPMFVASGENFADALSAGPAAVKAGAPLLLARRDELPAATASEIMRLQPQQITVVGGPATISESVLGQIRNLVPTTTMVTRVSGIDRYEVSRNLAQRVFGSATHGYVATGTNFPDALSAGAAAGGKGEPLVLVDGSQGAADAATLETFRSLRTMSNTVVGGGGSVSAGVEGSLNAVGSVNRLAGVDRYGTSIAVNQATFTRTLSTVYLATGLNYPDALVGSVIAGRTQSPLYVVPGTCAPQPVLDEIARLGATSVVLLGGTASLSPAVADLVPCP
ncbi:cell wall-binding repeat-containing protein [Herbiconiux solani]|uniref:cell wall-binding repeat-containing protein n=1 Tax=Herbiconiux solani TaxID=661329 RepID=UPI001FDF79D9|nr:cell wall-binding repeat-containing protein [Herbiconiux solani]